jgi:drug/metabolite transporter (DMT)-like permease
MMRSSELSGIVCLLVGLQLLPVVDGIARLLSAEYPVAMLVWGRYTFHLLIVMPVALWRHGRHALMPAGFALQLARGALLLACTFLFFLAVSHMPVADAIALVFVYPFLVTALSPLVLGEHVGARRWAAVAVGFVGVLVVVRPGGGFYPVGTPLALGAGSLFAVYVLVTRRLAGRAPPLVGLAFAAVVGAVVMNVALPFIWQPPPLHVLALMAVMGLLTAAGHGLVMRAYELAPAPLLAPLGYSEIVGAVVVGWILFREFPDAPAWLGIAIICAGGVYISLRERQRGISVPRNVAPPG